MYEYFFSSDKHCICQIEKKNDCFAADKFVPVGDNDERKRTFYNIKLWKIIPLRQRNGKSNIIQRLALFQVFSLLNVTVIFVIMYRLAASSRDVLSLSLINFDI